jgi:hypothetical protein
VKPVVHGVPLEMHWQKYLFPVIKYGYIFYYLMISRIVRAWGGVVVKALHY